MTEKLNFIQLLFNDLLNNFKIHVEIKENHDREVKRFRDGKRSYYPYNTNDMNKNHGKVALRRKITYLRQELLNLERMLDE